MTRTHQYHHAKSTRFEDIGAIIGRYVSQGWSVHSTGGGNGEWWVLMERWS